MAFRMTRYSPRSFFRHELELRGVSGSFGNRVANDVLRFAQCLHHGLLVNFHAQPVEWGPILPCTPGAAAG